MAEQQINKSKADEQDREYHLTVPLSQLNVGKFVASSSAVYMAENIIYYPFDLVRTKLQVQRDANTFGTTWRMIRSLGLRGLYTGFWASTIGSLPSHGVYFVSYNLCKDKLQEIDNNWHKDSHIKGKQALWVSFTAGAAADIIANVFVVPVEVVVSRLQIQEPNSEKKYKGSLDAIRTIYKYEGFRGFYRGFGATVITYAPSSAIWWTVYERCKVLFSDHIFLSSQHSESKKIVVEQSIGAQVFAGGIAGILTALITNPLDVVKTRLQTQHHHQQIETEAIKTLYKNTWEGFKHIAKDEGYRAFAKGLGPRVVTSAFFSSWFGFIYEAVLEFSKK